MRVVMMMALAAIPVIAFAQQAASHIRRTNPPTLSKPTGYTHVVEVVGPGKIVYIAGQVAADKDGKVVGERDMKAQTEQVFRNLEAALKTAGATFADVVKMNTYVTDLSQIAGYRDVRTRYVGDGPPASTLVQVVALANPAYLIEVEVVAAVK